MRWPAPGGYPDFADKNAMVITIIEQKQAVERIDEIVSVPGIDVVFIGPSDLSHSYGFHGQQTPAVKDAIAKVVAACKRHNVPVGRTAGATEIEGYVKEGFQFFQASTDLGFMAAGARPVVEAAAKIH
jgi:2-keto-3-deoxy-L-rhamnonate aldolase RhmA